MSEREQSFRNRRKQADWVVNSAAVLSVVSWVVAFFVVLLLDIASERPAMPGLASWLGGAPAAAVTTWNAALLPIGLILLVVSFLCSVAAFMFNMMRMRRKTDKYRKSVIIMGLITLAGIIAYVFRFGAYIF